MRHELPPGPMTPGVRSMGKAPAAGTLVASSGFPNAIAACVGGAVAAVSIVAIAPAADKDLHPASGTQVKTASSLG